MCLAGIELIFNNFSFISESFGCCVKHISRLWVNKGILILIKNKWRSKSSTCCRLQPPLYSNSLMSCVGVIELFRASDYISPSIHFGLVLMVWTSDPLTCELPQPQPVNTLCRPGLLRWFRSTLMKDPNVVLNLLLVCKLDRRLMWGLSDCRRCSLPHMTSILTYHTFCMT